MKAIITGSTGMVGRGVLIECLESPEVERVLLINRAPLGFGHSRITEIIHYDFHDLEPVRDRLRGYDACFFCLGVSVVGMTEEDYIRTTYTLTSHFAATLHGLNSNMVFCYVSGLGTDSSGQSKTMWSRVKGQTEHAILNMGFRDAYAFRPGLILPEKGVRSKTVWYNASYALIRPLFPLLKRFDSVTTSARVGRAMIRAASQGYPKKHLENEDINRLALSQADD